MIIATLIVFGLTILLYGPPVCFVLYVAYGSRN